MNSLAALARSLKAHAGVRSRLPAFIYIADRGRTGDPGAVVERLPAGGAVLLRDYAARDRQAVARRLARTCRRRRLAFIVAGDERLARAVGADGLHLPEHRTLHRPAAVRRPGTIMTAAAHDLTALRRAAAAGADAALVSPVFPTASHPDARTLGPVRLAALARRSALPVYALGGIDARTAARLRGTGVAGIAAIGGFAEKTGDRPASGSVQGGR